MNKYLDIPVTPDYEDFVRCIRREGDPKRVHAIELFLDEEVKQAIWDRFGLGEDLDPGAPDFRYRREVEIQRFLGYDYVRCAVERMDWPLHRGLTDDTAGLKRVGGRSFVDEHAGPITNWREFEEYPWPDPAQSATDALEWCERNLPEGMCVVAGGGFAHFAEHLTWLMGYETLCLALYDQRDLVGAIARRLEDIYRVALQRVLQFSCVKVVWGSDDMGYRGGTLLSPDDCREFFLPGHREMARMSHEAGKPYLLHSCGNLAAIMDDLIDDVRIDAKHSFEDTIEDVCDAKRAYGQRIALLGGIDVDFLCRADEAQVRRRVRETLDVCMPGGGYCLGTGNSVANYIPVENYLAMLDEGRKWG
jgi:uroporphyrinogen decarboxylase